METPTTNPTGQIEHQTHAAALQSLLGTSLPPIGVYTGLADDEAYVVIPGASLGKLVTQLAGVAIANVELEKFHQARARA